MSHSRSAVCCQDEGGGKLCDEGLCSSRLQLHQKRLLQGEKTFSSICVATTERHVVLIVLLLSVRQPPEEMVFSGKYKTGEQILRLANERFAVPEMLFHPADIGIQEMGIPEAIVDSIESLPEGQTTSTAVCSVLNGGGEAAELCGSVVCICDKQRRELFQM